MKQLFTLLLVEMFMILAGEADNIISSCDNYFGSDVGSIVHIIAIAADSMNINLISSSDKIMGIAISSNVHDIDC